MAKQLVVEATCDNCGKYLGNFHVSGASERMALAGVVISVHGDFCNDRCHDLFVKERT